MLFICFWLILERKMKIKESYIKDKVIDIFGRMKWREQSKNLEANRVAARVGNLCRAELERCLKEVETHMIIFIHDSIKNELK